MGWLAGFGRGLFDAVNNFAPVLFKITDVARACRAAPRAGIPSTVTESPMWSEVHFQPSRCRSRGFPTSTAQFATVPMESLTLMKTKALGLTQSIRVTMPRKFQLSVAVVSSGLRALGGHRRVSHQDCQAQGQGFQLRVILRDSLVPSELKIPIDGTLAPGPDDGAMVSAHVFQFSVGDDVNRLAGLIFHIRFETNGPVGGIEGDDAGCGISSRIDDAVHFFPIPSHHDGDLGSLGGGRTPVAVPGTRQGVSLLRESRCGHSQERQETQMDKSSSHEFCNRPHDHKL